jgi:hypothetical protein
MYKYMGLFMVGVPKEGKKNSRTFMGVLFANNIDLKQI